MLYDKKTWPKHGQVFYFEKRVGKARYTVAARAIVSMHIADSAEA